VEPNHVYVIPPNKSMTIRNGILRLIPAQRTLKPHRSIDDFLESLARDQGPQAVGIVLSGSATDGTLGLEAIKDQGGITFAQEEKSAKYASMPRSAIASGARSRSFIDAMYF
jgi:two-component system, chemotaxis family, CheB/CheR fusion protein